LPNGRSRGGELAGIDAGRSGVAVHEATGREQLLPLDPDLLCPTPKPLG
jgi:hypothetical protein